MKKVLIITYYWPPAGGGGVQRWLKFSKYLGNFGWQPVIYTAEGGEIPAYDESLVQEIPESVQVIKLPIWEPYNLYKSLIGKKKDERIYSGFITEGKKESLAQRMSVFIRGNFFIPDARKFWIRPSIKFLRSWLSENKVDAIISTGPPHSMHLIALGVVQNHQIPWIADFRDPWTNIDFYDQLKLTRWADKKHKRLEKKVLNKADKVVTVSWAWADDFQRISGRDDIVVLNNGYDPADFSKPSGNLDEAFSICHIGSMNKDRNPRILWKVLKAKCDADDAFRSHLKIVLVGQADFSIIQSIENEGLGSQLEKIDFMPHSDVVQKLQSSQLLLLAINETPNAAGVLPGKLYEYLGAKRPILCIGPPSQDAGRIIRETQSGSINDYDDFDGLMENVSRYYYNYLRSNLEVRSSNIEKYTRSALAGRYTELLNDLILQN